MSVVNIRIGFGQEKWTHVQLCVMHSSIWPFAMDTDYGEDARGDLVVPRTRLQLGNRAFCVAGPVAWNSLPLDILSAPTL